MLISYNTMSPTTFTILRLDRNFVKRLRSTKLNEQMEENKNNGYVIKGTISTINIRSNTRTLISMKRERTG